jgi:hypothetical protein
MYTPPFDADTIDKYQKVRALAERGVDGERVAAQRILTKIERDNPGIREHVDRMEAARARRHGGAGPQQPDWSKVAEQAADFLGNVFRDIQREAEKQQQQRQKRREPDPEPDEEASDEDDDLVDELFTFTTNVTKAGKVTLKIEIDPESVEALLDTSDDEDDIWMILQAVGARVADELGDVLLDEDDED